LSYPGPTTRDDDTTRQDETTRKPRKGLTR